MMTTDTLPILQKLYRHQPDALPESVELRWCPAQTSSWRVFRLNFRQKGAIEPESLGGICREGEVLLSAGRSVMTVMEWWRDHDQDTRVEAKAQILGWLRGGGVASFPILTGEDIQKLSPTLRASAFLPRMETIELLEGISFCQAEMTGLQHLHVAWRADLPPRIKILPVPDQRPV